MQSTQHQTLLPMPMAQQPSNRAHRNDLEVQSLGTFHY
jgi:hypothetical protein